jgi:hypothetical protein
MVVENLRSILDLITSDVAYKRKTDIAQYKILKSLPDNDNSPDDSSPAFLSANLTAARFTQRLSGSVLRFAVGIFVLLPGYAVSATPTVSDTGYEIIHRVGAPSLFWLDDDRLLFAGIKTESMQRAYAAKEANRVERLTKLYLWDAATKSVREHAQAQSVCVANGVVYATVRIDKAAGRLVLRQGLFGAEKEIHRPLPSGEEQSISAQRERIHSNFTCRTHLRRELSPPVAEGRRIIVLREGDGYLDAGPQSMNERVEEIRANGPGHIKLFRPGSKFGIDLPMTLEQGPGYPIYSGYRGEYVTMPRPKGSDPSRITSWPRGVPFTAYRFKPSGETSEIKIPSNDLLDIARIQPTKAGWIFSGSNSNRSSSGLYLFDKKLTRLDKGLVREIVISPNGCEAAVAIQNRHLEMGTPTNLRIFELCRVSRPTR